MLVVVYFILCMFFFWVCRQNAVKNVSLIAHVAMNDSGNGTWNNNFLKKKTTIGLLSTNHLHHAPPPHKWPNYRVSKQVACAEVCTFYVNLVFILEYKKIKWTKISLYFWVWFLMKEHFSNISTSQNWLSINFNDSQTKTTHTVSNQLNHQSLRHHHNHISKTGKGP